MLPLTVSRFGRGPVTVTLSVMVSVPPRVIVACPPAVSAGGEPDVVRAGEGVRLVHAVPEVAGETGPGARVAEPVHGERGGGHAVFEAVDGQAGGVRVGHRGGEREERVRAERNY